MAGHAALRVDAHQVQRLPFPSCPECHAVLIAPAASAHVSERDVRHAWLCEECGHAFTTTVRLNFREARRGEPVLS
jgi:RNase P subunit RPR2